MNTLANTHLLEPLSSYFIWAHEAHVYVTLSHKATKLTIFLTYRHIYCLQIS